MKAEPGGADRLYYYAYGSNMCEQRLRNRIGEVKFVQTYRLSEHSLRFHMLAKDDSTKCDVYATVDPGDYVLGGVYSIPGEQKRTLDGYEGLGFYYEEAWIQVNLGGRQERVFYYVAKQQRVDTQSHPYSWYKELVLEGARQHKLYEDSVYFSELESVVAVSDPDRDREIRELQNVPCDGGRSD